MKFNRFKKAISVLLAVCVMSTSAGVVFANETPGNITLTIKDVTEGDTTTATAKGQAKFEVSMQGASGNAKAVQVALNYEGDDGITYKSTHYIIGDDDPDNGAVQIDSPKSNKGLWISVIDVEDGIDISNNQTLFIVTFEGDEDKDVSLKCIDFENTYVEIDGNKIYPDTQAAASAKTSTTGVDTITGKVVLTMDKVTDFSVSDGAYSGITLKITSETTDNTISVVLSQAHKTGSGNTPVYEFNNNLIDDTYTVELSGIGYVTYKKTGVTFDETVNITNSDFIPGDINGDGKVDSADKTLYNGYIASGDYNEAADLNRDGEIDKYGDNVYENISDSTGGDTGNTGSGENTENDGSTGGDNGGSSGGSTGGNGSDSGGGGGAGGGGGSSSGGGAGGSAGGSAGGGFGGGTTTPTTPPATKTFTDLANYGWAENAIYTLKDKGIISGISNTEYAPANNIKRGDFILILTRMLKLENTFTDNFADVPESAYYYDALGKAKAAGIASGDGVNFMPENTITRQDLITLAYRAFLNAGYIEETTDYSVLDQFADKAEITDYAQAPLASMVKAGIITGDGTNVNPKGFATRAEVAVMCERLLALIK